MNLKPYLAMLRQHISAHRTIYGAAVGVVALSVITAAIVGWLWTYILGYLGLLGFVCFQVVMLSRLLRSAAWRWFAAGFVVSFAITILLLLLRPIGLTWAVVLFSLIRAFGGLACIAVGNHKLRADLKATLEEISKRGDK